jgi:molecular chaperone DnaK
VFTKMIERNTAIPHKKTETFTTYADFQPSVEIKVLQGERAMASDNKQLGVFTLADIPPAPRGMPKIDVTFDIDANGIVNVSAREQQSGKEQKITITGSSGLSKDDIDRMVTDAEKNAAADEERRRKVETKNQLDSLVFQAQKFSTDSGDKIGADEKTALEGALAEAQEALKGDDENTMKAAAEKLQAAYHAAGTSAYQQAEQAAQPEQPSGSDFAGYEPTGDGATPSSSAGDTVEGEVVEGEVTDSK